MLYASDGLYMWLSICMRCDLVNSQTNVDRNWTALSWQLHMLRWGKAGLCILIFPSFSFHHLLSSSGLNCFVSCGRWGQRSELGKDLSVLILASIIETQMTKSKKTFFTREGQIFQDGSLNSPPSFVLLKLLKSQFNKFVPEPLSLSHLLFLGHHLPYSCYQYLLPQSRSY